MGEAGAGETEVDVVGVVAVISVMDVLILMDVEMGDAGPERTRAGGMNLAGGVRSNASSWGESGRGMRWGEGGGDITLGGA